LQAAHAQSCLELVEDLGPRLLAGNEQVGAIERLEPELDNLRAAMQFGLDNDTEVLARLVYASGYLFFIRGHDREVRRWAKVASATGAGTMSVRGRLLRFAGRAALYARDLEEARRYFEEALSCARQGADDQWLGEVLRGLGDLATTEGDGRRARSLYEEARAASEACGNERSTASILASLANLALTESRWSDAFALSEESLVKSREIGDQAGEATGLVNLALAALRLGRSSEAKRALACMSTLALPDPEALAGALETLAWLLAAAGRGAASAESLGAAAELHEKMGTTRGTPEQAIRDEAIHRLNSLMRSDELEAAILRGRGLPPESALRRALAALD
jgi:non-specific serine/threonine protein kinase